MDDPETSDRYPDATGKGDIRIPGAGTAGMVILIVSLTILFLASMAAYVIIRVQMQARLPQWPPPGMPAIPNTLWLSTLVILCTSVTIQMALNAIRRDDEKKLALHLRITFALGLLFLIMQTINWLEFYFALNPQTNVSGPYLGMFYILTGLHAAHVIGGLIPLAVVIHHAAHGKYSRNFYPGVRYSCIYWHFLDVIWVALFCTIYF
jgi:cytochrome c oxidase subunit 3